MSSPHDLEAQTPANAAPAGPVEVHPAAEAAPVVPPAPPPGGLKRALMSSALWTVLGFGVMMVLRFGSNIILSRLLYPEAFGLMALVNAFIMGIHMFSDVGIGPSIIQSRRGEDPDFLNTAWTLQIVRGFLLWAALGAFAYPVASFYGEPQLLGLLAVAGLGEVIGGFNSTALSLLSRRLIQGRQVVLDTANYAVSVAITIAWVYAFPTIWALVIGGIISSVIFMTASHFLLPGFRNRLRWEKSAVHELVHFGKWVFLSTVFTFLAGQADRLVVGTVSFRDLGVYHFAAMLAGIPLLLMYKVRDALAFPLYSKLHQQGSDIRAMFSQVHPWVAGFGALLVSGLIVTGTPLIKFMYDFRYQDASWMLQLLTVGVWFQILEVTGGSILWALGRPQTSALSNATKVLILVVGIPAWQYHARDFYTANNLPNFRYPEPARVAQDLTAVTGLPPGAAPGTKLYLWHVEKEEPGQDEYDKVRKGRYLVDAAGVVRYVADWPRVLAGLILIFVAGDFMRYLLTLVMVRREGVAVIRYDLALTVLVAATSLAAFRLGGWLWTGPLRHEFLGLFAFSPEAGLPGGLPWSSLYLSARPAKAAVLLRLVIDGTIIVVLWSVLTLACWTLGIIRIPRRGGDA